MFIHYMSLNQFSAFEQLIFWISVDPLLFNELMIDEGTFQTYFY